LIEEIVPIARKSAPKAKSKASLKSKPSAKSKPSIKSKASAILKQQAKNGKDPFIKAAVTALKESNAKDKSAALKESDQSKECYRVISEAAGVSLYGKTGWGKSKLPLIGKIRLDVVGKIGTFDVNVNHIKKDRRKYQQSFIQRFAQHDKS